MMVDLLITFLDISVSSIVRRNRYGIIMSQSKCLLGVSPVMTEPVLKLWNVTPLLRLTMTDI